MTEAPDHLGRSAVRGAAAIFGARGVGLVVQLASVAVLSRFLDPRDYGLVAMVLAVIGIGEIFRDFGLSSAAIQAPSLSREQRDNLWWWNAAIGLVLSLVAAALAPVLAAVYSQDEVLPIALALAPTFLLSGLATQYRADLQRHLRFSSVAVIELSSSVLALVCGVVIATQGGGYWALVLQQVASGLFVLVGLGALARWLPRGYRRDAPMRPLFSFGAAVLGSQTITYISRNMDAMVIGRVFGAHSLGFYNRGLQLVRIPLNQLQGPIATVALSVLSRVQDDDRRLLDLVRRGQLVLAYPLVALAAGIAATSPVLVPVVLGDGWSETVPLLRLVAIGEGLNMLSLAGAWIYLSRGLSRPLMLYSLFSAGLRIAFLAVGATFGLEGVATAYALVPVVLVPISLTWAGRVARVDTRPLLAGACRVAVVAGTAGVMTAALVHALGDLPAAAVLVLALAAHGALVVLASVVPAIRRDYLTVWAVVRTARSGGAVTDAGSPAR